MYVFGTAGSQNVGSPGFVVQLEIPKNSEPTLSPFHWDVVQPYVSVTLNVPAPKIVLTVAGLNLM